MSDDALQRAKALLGTGTPTAKAYIGDGKATLDKARAMLETALDVYVIFDTTGSMSQYVYAVRENLSDVTTELLKEGNHLRLSMNGVGDHCDGRNWLQQYPLSGEPEMVQRSLDSIVMTNGGDAPEAYECMALALAQRLPKDSVGRKKAVVLIADSVPHGMVDGQCNKAGDYGKAFAALKTLCDGFYLVGCEEKAYGLQRRLVDESKPAKEQFIPLGDMVEVLPQLLIALAKKSDSEKSFLDYLQRLELASPEKAGKVRGLLSGG